MIAIVTDSTACLTKQDARNLGVIYAPIMYSVEGQTSAEEYVDVCGDFPPRLRQARQMSTSQTTSHAFMRLFTLLRKEGYEILCITISSRLSGTYNNAAACAKELGGEGIRVIDSLTTAGGLMILAMQARRLIEGGATLDEVADAVARMTRKVRLLFSVEDLGPLRRSGRLGPVKQGVSTILNIRPILSCENGRIAARKMARGNKERLRELIESVPPDALAVVVMNYECGEEGSVLAAALQERCACPVLIRMIGPSLAIHVGEGSVGVAWLEA